MTKTNAVLSLLKGYKHTEIGPIPSDWDVKCLGDLGQFLKGKGIKKDEVVPDGMPCVRYGELYTVYSNKIERTVSFINESTSKESIQLRYGDLLFAGSGETKEEIGKSAVILRNDTYAGGDIVIFRTKDIDYHFLGYLSNFTPIQKQKSLNGQGDAVVHIYSGGLSKVKIPLPPTLTEQKAIATALSDVDALISSLEKLIAKKKAIKQGAMQELLTPPHKGGKRLAGFSEDWEFLTIELVADCLDNLRVPLNGEQRAKMNGDIPYCGANGVVDYVNDFVIDDDIILMAEDGGYFDEYKTRPIAYRMKGKCWVNNHAHILKAKKGIDQGFLYFSLVHKNILDYINGGTRAKLNKGEMNKIECWFPQAKNEQKAIAQILTDMDSELVTLEKKKEKYQQIKQGMMQELLTGKTRLV